MDIPNIPGVGSRSEDRPALAIFVRTPGVSPIKTKLSTEIGAEQTLEFYSLAIDAVRSVASSAQNSLGITPYWAVAEESELENPLWSSMDRISQGEGELGARLYHVYEELRSRHTEVLLIGSDSPQLTVSLIQLALETLRLTRTESNAWPFVLGRTQDGGYYLFGGQVPVPLKVWESVTYGASTTAQEFSTLLDPLGTVSELPILRDVDTLSDLQQLAQIPRSNPKLLAEQVRVLEWAARHVPNAE